MGKKTKASLIGIEVKRKGKCPVLIISQRQDGVYMARKVLPTVNHRFLLEHFPAEKLVVGAIIDIPDRRNRVELVAFHELGYWDVTCPNDLVEVTPAKIEEWEGEVNNQYLHLGSVSMFEGPLR